MPELDAILGVKIPVLDDGFVRVVDYMGDDAAIVQAARAGTGKTRSDNAIIDPLSPAAPHYRSVRDVPDKAPRPHAYGLLESVDQPRDRRGAPGLPDSCPRRDLLDHRPAQPVCASWTSAPTATSRLISAPTPRPSQRRSWRAGCRRRMCAFCDYRLDSMTLSVTEKDVTSALVQGDTEQCLEYALAAGWVDARGKPAGRNRERDECDEKLAILGLGAPWND